jgi:hypothetical protein
VVLVDGTPIDAVNAQQLKLVLAIKGDEIVVDKTFLGQLVVIGH